VPGRVSIGPADPSATLDRRKFIALSVSALASLAMPGARWSIAKSRDSDDSFLDDMERRCFSYFLENTDASTGLTLDRGCNDGGSFALETRPSASIAVTGFGLASLCIAADRGWISHSAAADRARTALQFLAERAPHEHGWFFHWMNVRTGERSGALWRSRSRSEASTIDTTFLLAGALAVREYFSADREITRLANQIYERVDFTWMLDPKSLLLRHGWTPEKGFIPHHWGEYSEASLLYLLAIGSPTHPIPPQSWYTWKRNLNTYGDYRFVGVAPLFTYQFSHAFVDFRGLKDEGGSGVDWFANSVVATRAHRQFCMDLAYRFPGYSDQIWGITASRSAAGYTDWGGPPLDSRIDGTVVPAAAAGSLMFTPDISLAALRAMKERHGRTVYDRYGFTDAFNPGTGWISPDATGLGLGISLLAAENLRTGKPWQWSMAGRELNRAMALVRLQAPHPEEVVLDQVGAIHADDLHTRFV
jgi:hypothetical protein